MTMSPTEATRMDARCMIWFRAISRVGNNIFLISEDSYQTWRGPCILYFLFLTTILHI